LRLVSLLSFAVVLAPNVASAQDGAASSDTAELEQTPDAATDPPATDASAPDVPPLDEQARTHFRAGRSYYQNGRYEDAVREWTRAHELSGRPEMLYNLYTAYDRIGDLDAAIAHLERYLQSGEVRGRTELQARLERMKQRHSDARPASSPVVAESGGVSPVVVASLVAAGLAAASFGVFAVLTTVEYDELAGSCGIDRDRTCSDDDVSALKTYSLVADVSLGVAAAGALVGVLAILLGGDDSEPPVAVRLQPRSIEVGAGGRF
jgi:tetratricopeptide (TPR) repeat protein